MSESATISGSPPHGARWSRAFAPRSGGIAVFRAAAGKVAEQWSCDPATEEVDSGPRAALSTRDGWLSFRA